MTITDEQLSDALRRLADEPSSDAFWDELRVNLSTVATDAPDDGADVDADADDHPMIPVEGRSARWRWLAAAAVVALIVTTAALVASRSPAHRTTSAQRPSTVLHDPLAVDLDSWVDPNLHWPPEAPDSYPIFDLSDLPAGWQVLEQSGTGRFDGPASAYMWTAQLSLPDGGLVWTSVSTVNAPTPAASAPTADTVDINGHPAQVGDGGLTWWLTGDVGVQVLGFNMTTDELIEAARALHTVESPTLPTSVPANAAVPTDAIIAGKVGGITWSAKATPTGALLVRAGDTVEATTAATGSAIIEVGVPGHGVVVAGDGPSTMQSVRVELSDGTTITVPAAAVGAHTWFAVPIPAGLDVIALSPLDAAGTTRGRTTLPAFSPYLAGSNVLSGVQLGDSANLTAITTATS